MKTQWRFSSNSDQETNKQTDNANKVTNPELFKKIGEEKLISSQEHTRFTLYHDLDENLCQTPNEKI